MIHPAPGITRDTEIRHSVQVTQKIASMLDGDESNLSLLMGNILKDLDNPSSELRFTSADVDSVRNSARKGTKSPILILLDEWSTMGRNRPKMRHLLTLLIKCQLFRAADFVASVIGEPVPGRPDDGPAARVSLDLPGEVENLVEGLEYPFSSHDINRNRPNSKPEINCPVINLGSSSNNPTPFRQISTRTIQYAVSFSGNMVGSDLNLMKFSRTQSTINPVSSQNISDELIPAISMLQNSNQTEDNIPELSLLNGGGSGQSELLPVVLQSLEISNGNSYAGVPNLSELMPANSQRSETNLKSSESGGQAPAFSQLFTSPSTSIPSMDIPSDPNAPAFSQLFNGNASTSQSQTFSKETIVSSSESD